MIAEGSSKQPNGGLGRPGQARTDHLRSSADSPPTGHGCHFIAQLAARIFRGGPGVPRRRGRLVRVNYPGRPLRPEIERRRAGLDDIA